MNIVFRVDAALHIGSGHVMRCLTLAQALKQQGCHCVFISRDFTGNLFSLIRDKGFTLYSLPAIETVMTSEPRSNQSIPHEHWLGVDYQTDAEQTTAIIESLSMTIDWLIVDHYAIDSRWQRLIRPRVNKIMVIDDLADRQHNCDVLLDQTDGRGNEDYRSLVTSSCQLLLGATYALLRDEFITNRAKSLTYFKEHFLNDPITRIFISFGGVDQHNCTGMILTCLQKTALSADDEVHIVVGNNMQWWENIRHNMNQLPCKSYLYHNINNIAEVMSKCNLAIGAGGTTSWERCALGLPSIVISMADNQDTISFNLAKSGAHWYAGKIDTFSSVSFIAMVNHALFDRFALSRLSEISSTLCDAKGSKRVVESLLPQNISFRTATFNDINMLYQWRNHPQIRKTAFNPNEIDYADHVSWMRNKLTDEQCHILIAINRVGDEIGCVRLDIIQNHAEVSIYLSPEHLHKGYGKAVLKELTNWVKETCQAVHYLKAQIKENNEASQATFIQTGYVKISSDYILEL